MEMGWSGPTPGQSVPLTFDHQGGAARVASFSVLPRYAFSSEVLIVLSAKKVMEKIWPKHRPRSFASGGSLLAKMRYNRGNEEENL